MIEDDLLILYICGKPAACVVALDKNSGKESWKALNDSFTYSSPIILSAAGQRQLIVWTQEAVTSLEPTTGKTWWRERNGSLIAPARDAPGAGAPAGDAPAEAPGKAPG